MNKLILACLVFAQAAYAQEHWPQELIITPEKTRFEKTSTYDEVSAFLSAISQRSPHVRLFEMGKSKEGKSIPVAVLADPMIASPEQAKASGKPIVYVQGNIHAGEVEGKEALLILMRDILLGSKKHLLQNQIILFAPIYNTDSNDKMAPGRRPSQEDSPLEVGLRENSQGLDLNRDGMKMEALETNGLFQNVLLPWDPHVFVDLHTTNGTWHAYSLTWAPSYLSSGQPETYDFTNDKMLPEITRIVKSKYDLNFAPYGEYELDEGWPVKNFYTYDHHPRYLVNQFGLRNRIAILSEAFSHERFYQRIYSTHAFVTEILEYVHTRPSDILDVTRRSEEMAIRTAAEKAGIVKKGVRFQMAPDRTIPDFITYDYVATDKPDGKKEYHRTGKVVRLPGVTYHARFNAVTESTLPRGYVIPAAFTAVADNLRRHGIKVQTLTKAATFTGEAFQIEKFEKAARPFQGHAMAKAEGRFKTETRRFAKGDYYVEMTQPLSNLVFYLLEPQSDDGLLTWNFFDEWLEKQGIQNQSVTFPVFKYYQQK